MDLQRLRLSIPSHKILNFSAIRARSKHNQFGKKDSVFLFIHFNLIT